MPLSKQSGSGKETPTVAKARVTPTGCRINRNRPIAPLWTHPTGSDFVRGSKLAAKPHVAEQRKLTRTQVLLLQSLWTPVERPTTAITTHHGLTHAKPRMSSVDKTPACNFPMTRSALYLKLCRHDCESNRATLNWP